MGTVKFFKCLSDETRLNLALLVRSVGEACVCDLTAALDQPQATISRHLAQLRNCSVLSGQRRGQWVYYSLHPELPDWSLEVLKLAAASHHATIVGPLAKLEASRRSQANC